mgnify:CR=1 FL=1
MENAICFNCGEPLFGMADADLCWDCAEDSLVQPDLVMMERVLNEMEQASGDMERSRALARRAELNRPW